MVGISNWNNISTMPNALKNEAPSSFPALTQKPNMITKLHSPIIIRSAAAVLLAILCSASSVQAASAIWTNAPTDAKWTNVLNWIGQVVPGTINNTGNNGVDSASVATFTNAIPLSGIGSAANPIIPDDGTILNGKARMLGQLNFNGPDCGAYVFYSPSAFQPRTTSQPETGVISLCIPSSTVYWNGSFIGAAVTTPQVFLIPVQIRLPSSTTGQYGFTNNATSPNATYYFNQLFLYPDATSRGCTFVFDGSNTGTNTVAWLSQSTNSSFSASCGVLKQGSGTWILSGTNNLKASTGVSIYGGTLIAKQNGAFGLSTSVTVSNATLQIDGANLDLQSAFILKKNGNIKANGTLTIRGVTVATDPGLTASLSTTSAGDILTVGDTSSKVVGGLADSVVNIAGPGTVALGFDNNNCTNKWSVNSGTLIISNSTSLGVGANINIAAGAKLDVTPLGVTTWNPTTAGVGGAGTGTTVGTTAATIVADPGATIDLDTGDKSINLTFTPAGFSGDTTHPALYVSQGALTLGGNAFTINNAGGSPLGVGTYTLIKVASGTITSAGGYSVTGVTGSGLTAGTVGEIQVSGDSVNLVVSVYVPKNLVWTGGPFNADWNINNDANWLDGVTQSKFLNSDNVTFNSVGLTNPTVNLTATVAPGTVTVDAASTYTFSGSGQIAGQASLIKKNSGTLELNTINTYSGGTVVSNGTIKVGNANAISSTGSGNVSVQGAGVIDLNGMNNAINGLNGDGTVDNSSVGSSILTIGNNDSSGVFSGTIKNTSAALAVTKTGTGIQTLSGANTYTGNTTISLGTVKAAHPTALGSGAVAVSALLDLATNLNVGSLSGSGSIANNSTTTTNQLIVSAGSPSSFDGSIVNGSGGGAVSLLVKSGTLVFSGSGNTYSGGSIVAAGAGLQINNSGSVGSGNIIVSNNAVIGMRNANNPSSGFGNTVTTVDGATILFTGGGNQANSYYGQFYGGVTSTNVYTNSFTIGSSGTWDNFLGRAIIGPSASIRIGSGTVLTSGGNNTTFDFQGGNLFSRDASTVLLGTLTGGSADSGLTRPSFAGTATWIIGGSGQNSVFSGRINNDINLPTTNNAVVKTGVGTLVLDGKGITTNTDNSTYTNYFYTDIVNYLGPTTVSNGVLALTVPITLSNSPTIRLAGTSAVLDARNMGPIVDQLDEFLTVTNQVLSTNGIFRLYSTQTLSGIGTIWGQLNAVSGATVSPGMATGTLTVTNGVTLDGVTMNVMLSRTNAANCGQLAASGSSTLTVNGGTLNITNVGPDLYTGTVFPIFNKACIGNFAITNLPASNALNTVSYVWTNKLAIDGTLVLLQGASPIASYPTNITATVNGSNLEITWPATHIGWILQAQTNSLTVGLTTNWVSIPSTATASGYTNTIDPTKGNVFYRLSQP